MISLGGPSELNCSTNNEIVHELEEFQWVAYSVALPLLIAVGILTNILDVVVLSRPTMRNVSYRYLFILAFTDLLYLVFNIPFCLKNFQRTLNNEPVSWFMALYYAHIGIPIVNVFLTHSIYTVVWLSYDRYLAVCRPTKFSSKQRFEVVHMRCGASFGLTVFMYMANPIRQDFTCVGDACCVTDNPVIYETWYKAYELIREIYSRFLPGILITGFNVTIISVMQKLKNTRNNNQRESSNDGSSTKGSTSCISEARQDRECKLVKKATQMCTLIVLLLSSMTVMFYVSTFPSAIYKIWNDKEKSFWPYFRTIADLMEVSGHVFNFVLYFLFSPDFRKTLGGLIWREEATSTIVSSFY